MEFVRVLSARAVPAEPYFDFNVPVFGNYWAGGLWHHNSGKTEILLKAISDLGERTLVLCHTERILRQWVGKAAARFSVPERRIGVLYGREKRDGDLIVGMIRSVLNKVKADPGWVNRWGTLILDEAHHCAASTFSECISLFPARNRLAATATPHRRDKKEPLFFDAFGVEYVPKRGGGTARGPRVLFEIRDEDLDRFNRIVPVDVVVVPTDFAFDLNREAELEAAGFERLERETGTAAVRRWAKETHFAGPLNTYAEMLDAATRDERRRARVLEYLLPEIAAGRTCLLLADRREMCLEIQAWLKRRGVHAGRLMGGRDAKEQDRTAEGLEDGTLRVAVGTTVADEGMDVKRLDRGFGMTPAAANPGRFTQQVGRLKRRHEGKVDAVYFYFWDRLVRPLRSHARAIRNAVQAPHRAWFSERAGERVELTPELLRGLEAEPGPASAAGGWVAVESENLAAVRRDGEDLLVRFRKGAEYVYPGAGPLLPELLAAGSKGRFFQARIRALPFRRLS